MGFGELMAFTPTDYPGLLGWWKADAITPVADATAISQWDDSSGNANHLVQADAAKQPVYKIGANGVNSLPVVRFAGTNDCLTLAEDLSARTGVTLYMMVRPTTISTSVIMAEYTANGGSTTGGFTVTQEALNGYVTYYVHHSLDTTTISNFVHWLECTTTPTIVCVRICRPVAKHHCAVFVNGDGLGAPTVDNKNTNSRYLANSSLNIGARNNGASLGYTGDFGEILLYGHTHTPDQRIAVEAYLADKWGVTVVQSTGAFVASGHSESDGESPTNKVRLWWRRSMLDVSERIDWFCSARAGSTQEKFEGQRYPRSWWMENNLSKRILSSRGPNNDIRNFTVAKTQFNAEQDWLDALATNATHVIIANGAAVGDVGRPVNFDADQVTVNDWMRANVPSEIIFIDSGADPNLNDPVAFPTSLYAATDDIHHSDPQGEAYLSRVFTSRLVSEVGLTRWAPTEMGSGLKLWLKADALALNNDDLVNTWTDSSGSGNHATAAGALRPTYKSAASVLGPDSVGTAPAVLFNGTGNGMVTPAIDMTGTSGITIWLVATAADDTNTHLFCEFGVNGGATNDSCWIARESDKKTDCWLNGNVGSNNATMAANHTSWFIIAAKFDKSLAAASEIRMRANGVETTAGAANNTNSFGNHALYIGSRANTTFWLNGYIAELIVLNRAATIAEFRRTESYLGTKYGLF